MELTTDYLVVGAGATGLAFTDALIADTDADVILLDRRREVGGHWRDTYPFVRLHTASHIYGVDSLPLGNDEIQVGGDNDGFYEQATGSEVQDYFHRVLDEVLRPTGQVRFLGGHEHLGSTDGQHVVRDMVSGEVQPVRVRRSLVDARYLESEIPATHTPSFRIAPEVTFGPLNDLTQLLTRHRHFTVIGGGKTAADAALFLLAEGIDPERIRWIRPRDAWFTDRKTAQPLDLVGGTLHAISLAAQIIAGGGDADTMFKQFEDAGQVMRLDPDTVPTMYRGSLLSRPEVARLRTITDVVRRGRLRAIEQDRLLLDEGEVAARKDTAYVDCSGYGLPPRQPKPIFEPGRITPQYVRHLSPAFNAALVGWVEAHRSDPVEKNRLCPPNPAPSLPAAWAPMLARTWQTAALWKDEPDLTAWVNRTHLNLTRSAIDHGDDPVVRDARERLKQHVGTAVARFTETNSPGTGTFPTPRRLHQ